MKFVVTAAGFVLSEENYSRLKENAHRAGAGRLFDAFVEPVEILEQRAIFRDADPEVSADFRKLTEWRGMK